MDRSNLSVRPEPSLPRHNTDYFRNVALRVRDRELVVTDPSGHDHVFPIAPEGSGRPGSADALAWVSTPSRMGDSAHLLVLDGTGTVLVTIASEGWDVDELRRFGDRVGLPLVEESYVDGLTARAAYPVGPGALRITSATGAMVFVRFLPVLVPVLLLIIVVLIVKH